MGEISVKVCLMPSLRNLPNELRCISTRSGNWISVNCKRAYGCRFRRTTGVTKLALLQRIVEEWPNTQTSILPLTLGQVKALRGRYGKISAPVSDRCLRV